MRAFNVIPACCVCLLAGCSSPQPVESHGTTDDSTELKVPSETSINPDAGRGNLLITNVRFSDGKKMPFLLDTGAGITCLDESLASKLGKQVGTVTAHNWGKDSTKKLYAAPTIYLGGARLHGGKTVMAMDLKLVLPVVKNAFTGITCAANKRGRARLGTPLDFSYAQFCFACGLPPDGCRSIRPSNPSTRPGLALAPFTATSGVMRTLRSPTVCMNCITV